MCAYASASGTNFKPIILKAALLIKTHCSVVCMQLWLSHSALTSSMYPSEKDRVVRVKVVLATRYA